MSLSKFTLSKSLLVTFKVYHQNLVKEKPAMWLDNSWWDSIPSISPSKILMKKNHHKLWLNTLNVVTTALWKVLILIITMTYKKERFTEIFEFYRNWRCWFSYSRSLNRLNYYNTCYWILVTLVTINNFII